MQGCSFLQSLFIQCAGVTCSFYFPTTNRNIRKITCGVDWTVTWLSSPINQPIWYNKFNLWRRWAVKLSLRLFEYSWILHKRSCIHIKKPELHIMYLDETTSKNHFSSFCVAVLWSRTDVHKKVTSSSLLCKKKGEFMQGPYTIWFQIPYFSRLVKCSVNFWCHISELTQIYCFSWIQLESVFGLTYCLWFDIIMAAVNHDVLRQNVCKMDKYRIQCSLFI